MADSLEKVSSALEVLEQSTTTYWTQPALWVVPEDLSSPEHPYGMPACQAASDILYILSGRKFPGLTQTTETYSCPYDGNNATAYHLGKVQPVRLPAFNTDHNPDHSRLRQRFPLRHYPVRQILSVITDRTQKPDAYYLSDYKFLNAAPGSNWRLCDGVTVIYVYGTPPPIAGRYAAKVFADELLKSVTDPEACQLPQRVTSVTRQGMSFTLLDPQDFLDRGKTGIYSIDLFLSTFNPNKAQKRSKTFNVDLALNIDKRMR
jgi:hypothetical protein